MRATILLVDDYEPNLIALQSVLDSPQYELVHANSGKEAVALCEKREFALVILDVNMPELDGYETAIRIKRCVRNRDVPIIFVTATYREQPFVTKGYQAGAVDYFGKPFEPGILKAKVSIYTSLFLKSKRLEQTEELLKTHAQIKILLEAMPVGVVVADSAGKIYEVNEEAKRIWGLDTCAEFKPLPTFESAYKEGEITHEQLVEIVTAKGRLKTVLLSAIPIRTSRGKIAGAVLVVQDVSHRSELTQALERNAVRILGV